MSFQASICKVLRILANEIVVVESELLAEEVVPFFFKNPDNFIFLALDLASMNSSLTEGAQLRLQVFIQKDS